MNDLRFAIRSLRRSPGFVFVAVVTLGLGIGANTSMFSVINGYMLRPSPYPDSDHLDRIYRTTPRNSQGDISPADYVDLKSQMNGYGEIAAYAPSGMSLSEPGKPAETASGLRVSAKEGNPRPKLHLAPPRRASLPHPHSRPGRSLHRQLRPPPRS